jgi:protein required for attachment to host cells
MITWILVANATHAFVFSSEKREQDWTLVKTFEHPEGRELSSELDDTSQPGRMLKSKGTGVRSAAEPRTTPKEAEAEHYAKLLASYLDHATAKGEFQELVIVAPPHFLGVLHGTLGQQTAKHLKKTIHKDFAVFEGAEIRKRLLDDVYPPA